MESLTESQQERQPESSGSGSPPIIPVVPVPSVKGSPQPAEVTAVVMDPAGKDTKNAPPTSTAEEDRKTAGQRNINEKWENTQQWIAIISVVTTNAACLVLIVCGVAYNNPEMVWPALLFMTTNTAQILTSYFTRTNHTKIGGVGGTDSR